MAKELTCISGAELVAALERVAAIMKAEVQKMPDMSYTLAEGGLSTDVSLAVVFTFDRETLRHESTKICSEKIAAKAWTRANGIKV